jgi:hypothetical protein
VRRRLTDALTALAAQSFPSTRASDGRVVRDCARDAIDASGLRVLPRELVSLAAAGLRLRAGLAARDLWRAPWRSALAALTLPLSSALLFIWVFGFIDRYDHWPLGEGWAMLLGGSLAAVVGAALRSRWLTATGAAACFVAAASPQFGFGREASLAGTPSFFDGGQVDFGYSSLVPTLLVIAGAFCLRRDPTNRTRSAAARLALGLLPAVILVALLPPPEPRPTFGMELLGPGIEPRFREGPPYPWPWVQDADTLVLLLAVALENALVLTWARARTNPAAALASGLVLASVAYPLAWVAIRHLPVPYWFYDARFIGLLTALPLLVALILMRRGARFRVT